MVVFRLRIKIFFFMSDAGYKNVKARNIFKEGSEIQKRFFDG